MDRCPLWPPDDVERDSLVRVAAQASNFEVEIPSIQRVAERGRWLRPVPESRACACSTLRQRADRRPCGLLLPGLQPRGSMRRKSSRVTQCPCKAEDRWAAPGRQAATDCGGWRGGHNGGKAAPATLSGRADLARRLPEGSLWPEQTWPVSLPLKLSSPM